MSVQTNELLHLFGELSRNPRFIMALRLDFIIERLRNRQSRNGARGLLVELWKKDGLTNAEIAELMDIRPSSVTAQVKSLEEKGLVTRVPDERDKRVSRVFLTEKGRRDKTRRREQLDDISEDIFGVLSDEDQKWLAQVLTKVLGNSQGKHRLEGDHDHADVDGLEGTGEDWAEASQAAGSLRWREEDDSESVSGTRSRLPLIDEEQTYSLTPRQMRRAASEFRKVQQDIMSEFRRNFRRMWDNGDFDQFRDWEGTYDNLDDFDDLDEDDED